MYNEPRNEENMRLKRDDAEKEFDVATFIGCILIPGVFGAAISIVLFIMLPSMVKSLSRQLSVNQTINNAFADVGSEFALLASMKWQDTYLWAYLLGGAILAIFLKLSYSDKLR